MNLFIALIKLSFQRQLAYRAANIAGLMTNLFFGVLRASVMMALYGARDEVAGISVEGAITYTGLTQAIIAYLAIFGSYEIMESVYSGEVSSDLLKPMGFFRFWLARDLGRAGASFLVRGLTVMGLYALMFDIVYPMTWGQWQALAISMVLGLLVSFAWRFLVNLSAFWTPNAKGVGRFAFGMTMVLSGFIMPLRFFPDWFVSLCYLTPFPAMINTSIEIYLGLLSGVEMAQALLLQGLWFLALALLCYIVFRAGVRHLVIQGG